jgi:hypothetical protein
MKYGVHQCTLCSRHYPANQIVLLKIGYKENEVEIIGTVNECYSGIRPLCHFCLEGLKKIEPKPSEV